MRKLFLILGIVSLAFGAWVLLYDYTFIRRYGVDANDVLTADGPWLVDWETGMRPAYADYPAWHYGIAFMLVAALFLVVRTFLPRKRKASTCELPVPSS